MTPFPDEELSEEISPFGIIESINDLNTLGELPLEMAEEESEPRLDAGHDENLAELMDESDLDDLASELLEELDEDLQARDDWEKTVREGLKLFGVIDDIAYKGPFPHATKVVFPTLSIATYQFQSRAIAELFPPKGPVKGMVVGRLTAEKEEQSKRVEAHMNYQLTVEDQGYFPDLEQMLVYLALYGSAFRKVYRDVITGKNIVRYIKAEDLVVPYNATSLETAQRFTHIVRMARNDVKKTMAAGVYRDVDLGDPESGEEDDPNKNIQELYAEAEDKDNFISEEDGRDILAEVYCYCDLPGFEDLDELGEPTGLALPYVITIHKPTKKILSIYRNWKDGDILKVRKMNIVHYYYLPGMGFYGYGLIQLVGSIAKAQTGILRCLLNAGTLASLQGGFKTRDSKLSGEQMIIEPGAYKDIDATYDDLNRAFWSPKFGEPSPVLMQLLGTLTDQAQRFTSTTEAMVGDAANTGPVGTTVALIEQGSKVYSSIHKRLHFAAGQEFRMLAALNEEYMPVEGYPYDVYGAERSIAKADYDERVDVIPVSDPNFFSAAQRLATAQAILQLAQSAPQLYDLRAAHKRMLLSMDVPDIDQLLPEPDQAVRHDPVTENALMIAGQPVKAFAEQDHMAHIQVHKQMMAIMAQQEPASVQILEPVMMAHLREHYAYLYFQQAQQRIGVQLPVLNIDPKPTDRGKDELPMQIENQVAQAAAMALQPPPQQEKPPIEEQEFQAEQRRADEELAREQQRDDIRLESEIERANMREQVNAAVQMKQADRQAQSSGGEGVRLKRGVMAAQAAETLGNSGGDQQQLPTVPISISLPENKGDLMLAQGLAQLAQAIAQMNGPKRVVRDESGEIIGTEPVEQAPQEPLPEG